MVLAVLVFAYLLGAIPFAVLVASYIGGIDLRHTGSGNTGAMNTIRSVGKLPGLFAGALDAAKGAIAMLVARVLIGRDAAALAGGVAIVGHCCSIWLLWAARHEHGGGWKRWLRRMGGKGLATGLAVLLIMNWPTFILMIVIFFVVFGLQFLLPLGPERRKDETWPTVIALALVPVALWYWTHNQLLLTAGVVLAIAIVIKHLPDLRESFYVA
ncbi:MAG: glycerol-3-phosphate acyltransferase [Herpetosiphonaceae bacterium]|nr:glycerol-3-phosphate acyltransferase [Herpetosiphonaceae bacterium]